jgi:dTDP-4-dehydrorhamnose 3,5-epimerase
MKVETTPLEGVLLITPPTIFSDHRGGYVELYNRKLYAEAGITTDFVEDDISISKRGVLRGIHGDFKTLKLVSCLAGAFYLVVVNADPSSPQFRQWTALTLSEENRQQVLIPAKFGNGHLVTSERAIFHYKQSSTYDQAGQFTIRWDDPAIGISWPLDDPTLSERDAMAPFLDGT